MMSYGCARWALNLKCTIFNAVDWIKN